MKYLHLVWAALFRRKTRTIFTLLSVLAAFLLFGLLDSVRSAFASAGSRRRRRRPAGHQSRKISFTLSLPKSLLRAHPGGAGRGDASPTPTGSAASTRTRRISFANQAVAPNFLDLYPEW